MATVLVVDDDPAVRQLVVTILEGEGHDVLPAANGLEGLMVYSSYRSRVDLIVTDIDMPQMNGIELLVRIRALDPAAKSLVMSGRVLEPLKRLEGCPSLSKPFHPQQLREAVKRLLTESS